MNLFLKNKMFNLYRKGDFLYVLNPYQADDIKQNKFKIKT